jgi:hypothetical protein
LVVLGCSRRSRTSVRRGRGLAVAPRLRVDQQRRTPLTALIEDGRTLVSERSLDDDPGEVEGFVTEDVRAAMGKAALHGGVVPAGDPGDESRDRD